MSSMTIGTLTGFLRADDSGMRRGLDDAELRMRGFQRDVEGRIRHLDGRFATLGEQLAAGLRTGTGEGRRFGFSLRRIISVAGGLGGVAMSFAKIGLLIGAAVPLAAGLAAAIANIAPAAALAATGIIAMQLATQTLKIGMIGVKEAITAALDPSKAEEFDEALKKLAPNARAFAKEIKALQPEFKKLQQDVQNRLFAHFDRLVKDLAKYTLPHVRKGLKETAAALNAMGLSAGNAAVRMGKNGTLGEAIAGATAGLKNLSRIPGQVVTGLIQIGAAAAPAFDRVTKAAGTAFDKLAEGIQKAYDSGALTEAIDAAIDNIKQLGRIAGNIFGGIGNIIKGVSVDGQGLFGTLEKITQAFEDLTASKEFQSALAALSRTVGVLVDTVLPLAEEAFKALLPVFEELAPPIQTLIKEVGEALGPVFEELGPVLTEVARAFGKMLPVISPFITLALELIAEILPSLTPLFEFLGEVFERLAPIAKEVAKNIGLQLKPILEKLPGILEQILPKFLDIADRIFPLLLEALIELGPELGDLAVALGDLLVELTPLIVKFLEFQVFLLDKMAPYIGPLAKLIGGILVGSLRLLTDFLREFAIPAVRTIVAILSGDFGAATRAATAFTNNLRESASKSFENLKTRGGQSMSLLASEVTRQAQSMATGFMRGVSTMVQNALRNIRRLPGLILNVLGNLDSLLYNAGIRLMNGFIAGIRGMVPSLNDVLSGITAMIPNIKGPPEKDAKLLTPAGRLVMEGFIRGIDSTVGQLRSRMGQITRDLPGDIDLSGATADLGSLAPRGQFTAASGGGVGPQKVVWEVRAGDSSGRTAFLVEEIRQAVRVVGRGSVQTAFGT